MPTKLDEIKNACAYIEAAGARGTGYLISSDLVVTCDHVIDRAAAGQVIEVRFGDVTREAQVLSRNDEADCAILRLTTPLTDVEPLQLSNSECSRGDTWDAYGFPAVTREAGHFLT